METSLDDIGILEGTDKTSLGQNYLGTYERIFTPIRDAPIELLEIGIANGGSLRSWERFFPRARIIGVDINDACKAFGGGRIQVEIGSQADIQFLGLLANKYKPTIIIDDGSHLAEHNFISFEYLFPSLRPGGYYVMEDQYLHFGSNASMWHPTGGLTPIEFFSTVAQQLSADYLEPTCDPSMRTLHSCIDGVEFFRGAIVIRKKKDPANSELRVKALWDLGEKGNHAIVWFGFSSYLIENEEYAQAEAAAQRAVSIKPNSADYLSRLGHAQALQGKLAAAVNTIRSAVRLSPGNEGLSAQLSRYESELGVR